MFALIDLIYSLDSLLPAISAETIGFHHGKHLAGYVANLNKAIVGTELESASLEEIVKVAEPGSGGARPEGLLAAAIDRDFGSFEAFKEAFVAAGISIFGSGWVWLQADSAGVLSIGKYSGADNPVTHGLRPLLTFDVWEHAYYLDYQNRRADHLTALWGIVDWEAVGSRFLDK